jgi:hypothetical protein
MVFLYLNCKLRNYKYEINLVRGGRGKVKEIKGVCRFGVGDYDRMAES